MFVATSLNLDIQSQYMDILRDFLDSEHKALQFGQIYDVYQLEKTIHAILKTLLEKRTELRDSLAGLSVGEYAAELPHHLGGVLRNKINLIARLEEECLTKASRNADLSMVLAGRKMAAPEHWNVFPAEKAAEGMVQ